MCTVSFLHINDAVYITSNRDEHHTRSKAFAPAKLIGSHGESIVYPKDPDGGGTWIALKENGNAAVLLNGGFVKHEPVYPYRKSRGLIFLEIIEQRHPIEKFSTIDLLEIEPFTLVLYFYERLFECRWDGEEKHISQLDAGIPHIWSSVTLYSEEIRLKRAGWFNEWMVNNPNPKVEDIIRFHQFAGDGDSQNNLLMNRDGQYFTVSITSLQINSASSTMEYLDLIQQKTHRETLTYHAN
jgi:Transport and Golgi organisation 2